MKNFILMQMIRTKISYLVNIEGLMITLSYSILSQKTSSKSACYVWFTTLIFYLIIKLSQSIEALDLSKKLISDNLWVFFYHALSFNLKIINWVINQELSVPLTNLIFHFYFRPWKVAREVSVGQWSSTITCEHYHVENSDQQQPFR